MRLLGFVAPALFALAPVAVAGPGGGHDPLLVVQHIFRNADTDQSGTLSRAEYEGAGLQHYGVSIEESDANGDGETSIVEYLELYQRHHPPADQTDV